MVQLSPAASAVGKTLAELDPVSRSGATLVAVRRGTELIRRPDSDIRLQPGDLLVFAGTADQVAAAVQLVSR